MIQYTRLCCSLKAKSRSNFKFANERGGWETTAADISSLPNQKTAHAIAAEKGPRLYTITPDGRRNSAYGIPSSMSFLRLSASFPNFSRAKLCQSLPRGLLGVKLYSSIAGKASFCTGGEMEKLKDNTHIERTSTQFRQRVINIFQAC